MPDVGIGPGSVQPPVQVVASHDLTFFVRASAWGWAFSSALTRSFSRMMFFQFCDA